MIVYTDSLEFAGHIVPEAAGWTAPTGDPALGGLAGRLFHQAPAVCRIPFTPDWPYLFLVETAPTSQFDLLVEMGRNGGALPDRTLCLAARGARFHGFRRRPWAAADGNIHLSVYFAPPGDHALPDVAFTVLAAVSVIDAIDALPGLAGRAGIKWINDVLVDGAKVCGVLAHTLRRGDRVVGAVLGIGLNVETTPHVEPTPFVPRAAALCNVVSRPETCRRERAFRALVAALDWNYRALLAGQGDRLVDRYRERSLVLGRRVAICAETSGEASGADAVVGEGRVLALGDDLTLRVEGIDEPVRKGRLILADGHVPAWSRVHGTS